jgi:hypothetical protein
MKIDNFVPLPGQHCETTATGSLLRHLGLALSEPMLFGLGEGLGFIFWNMKTMDFPFIGGRIKADLLTQNICRHLHLTLHTSETTSPQKSWKHVSDQINAGIPVGLKLDCFHLEYFSTKFHFAGHYVAMYGYDDNDAYLVDTEQQGGLVKTSLKSLALARSEKGPMSSNNLSYTISRPDHVPALRDVIGAAIRNNAHEYLHPPIKNISYKGILKASDTIKPWFDASKDRKRDFQTTAILMERAGTGGSLFRNLYRDFLLESYKLTSIEVLNTASDQFRAIAQQWTAVADCFHAVGDTEDEKYIREASNILVDISEKEKITMQNLLDNFNINKTTSAR